jgi:hypothetical protein
MKRAATVIILVLLVGMTAIGQYLLKARRPGAESAVAEGVIAALGGFRSLAAEVIWFRADRLQDEGRYVEMAQLASLLTKMEPHTPEVWTYAAWNLSYNISVMMPTFEDRWRWVLAGMRLLRDEGLPLNPNNSEIYRELAWLFQLKLGANLDSAAELYREKWRAIVTDVKARNAWAELKMDPARMAYIEKHTGFNDWTRPSLSAIYWAARGLEFARDNEKGFLQSIIRQSTVMYKKAVSKEKKEKES